MKKQAIIIIAHDNLKVLNRLLELLDSKYFDIFLHIDIKSKINNNILYKFKYSKLFFYKLLDIRWGDYSMIEAELFLFEEASKNNYEYYHLISGVDLPINSNKYIYDIFHNNYPKEFIHYNNEEDMNHKIEWVKYDHDMKSSRNNPFFEYFDFFSVEKQKEDGVNRIFDDQNTFKSGANWVSITHQLVEYILSKKEYIEERFQNTRSGDEMFIQTLVYNSKFKDNLYYSGFDDNYDACLREIDWNRGNPYVWRKEDYDYLISSKKVFARKFNYKIDSIIIDKIYNYVKELNNKDEIETDI